MRYMNRARLRTPVAAVLAASLTAAAAARASRGEDDGKLKIVTTLHVLAAIASDIVADRGTVMALARPTEDPHFVQATPQRMVALRDAQVFIESGLQLELWDQNVIDGARNPKIQRQADGFCRAATGAPVLQIPTIQGSRALGDVHADGNPHLWFEPFIGHVYAKNIEACLSRVDGRNQALWEKNRKAFDRKLDEAIFGKELCDVMGGGARLEKLTRDGGLDDFLAKHKLKDVPLSEKLGGLMKKARPLKGAKVVAYHNSWCYFEKTWGCEIVGFMEPKPGIPPTASHLEELEKVCKQKEAKVVLVTSYEPKAMAEEFAARIGAKVVLLPADVDAEGTTDFVSFQTTLVERVVEALEKK